MDETNQTSNSKRICFSLEKDKIRQSVEKGSVFLALSSNFFTAGALLEWLTTVDMSDVTQVAYKAVCETIHPDFQYMSDTYHFLTQKPEYAHISIGFGLSDSIADRNTDSANPIIAHLCVTLIQYNKNINVKQLSDLIIKGEGPKSYVRDNLTLCCKSRNLPYLRDVTAHEYNQSLVDSDWTEKFRYNDDLPLLIINRVIELQSSAPFYYANVAYKAYHKVALLLNKEKLLYKLSRLQLSFFNSFFPNVIDERILSCSDLAYKIMLLGNDIAGYILGFPIQTVIPNDEQIYQAIKLLSELGSEKYAESINTYLQSSYNTQLPIPYLTQIKYANDTDVMMEDINNYSPFDIVYFQQGDHVYRFTRPEFSKLLESKKNPWTNEWLPPTILSSIESRASAAKELGLPSSRTMLEMFTHITNDTQDNNDDDSSNNETYGEILQHQMFTLMFRDSILNRIASAYDNTTQDINEQGDNHASHVLSNAINSARRVTMRSFVNYAFPIVSNYNSDDETIQTDDELDRMTSVD